MHILLRSTIMISRYFKSALVGVVVLVLGAASASAGSITYDFVEDSGGPNPGTVGGFFVFASPPASATSSWSTSNPADVLDFEITDPKIGPVGSYLGFPAFVGPISSNNGTSLDAGAYLAENAAGNLGLTVQLGPAPLADEIVVAQNIATGNFVLVPEPSSLLLAGTATLAGLGFWVRRRSR
jgi:hypothetical protein